MIRPQLSDAERAAEMRRTAMKLPQGQQQQAMLLRADLTSPGVIVPALVVETVVVDWEAERQRLYELLKLVQDEGVGASLGETTTPP